MRTLAVLIIVAALPACSVALHGNQATGTGAATTATSSSLSLQSSASGHSVASSFGRTLPAGAGGGHVSVPGGTGAAVLLLGIMVINAIDYVSGGWGSSPSSAVSAARPIAHTCSCYGYRPYGAQAGRE